MFSGPVVTVQQDIETSMHNTTKLTTAFDYFLGFVFWWSLHNNELSAELAAVPLKRPMNLDVLGKL